MNDHVIGCPARTNKDDVCGCGARRGPLQRTDPSIFLPFSDAQVDEIEHIFETTPEQISRSHVLARLFTTIRRMRREPPLRKQYEEDGARMEAMAVRIATLVTERDAAFDLAAKTAEDFPGTIGDRQVAFAIADRIRRLKETK